MSPTSGDRQVAIEWLTCLADGCPEIGADRPPGFLSLAEQEVLARLRFPKRRREWLLGRWTSKCLLQRCHPAYKSLSLQAITVGNDIDGAPFISIQGQGRLAMSLSISHRDDRAFCALSPTLPPFVGADLEYVESRDPAFVRDFFTTGESARVWSSPPSRRDTLVTVIWSAKEAVLKVLRHGLRVDTRRVEVLRVAGMEQGESAIDSLCSGRESNGPKLGLRHPEVVWHEIEIQYAPELLPDVMASTRIRAWWRPWEDYVLTLASRS